MNRGGKAALLISAAGLGGCSASMGEVKVRPLADPSAVLRKGDAVAAARGQFMIGNVGLALEGFRKAQRDNPADPAALAGIADCYGAMGRYDLAQSNYEAALALAPHDPRLLLRLAAVFEREGKVASAIAARAEATAAATPASSVAKQAVTAPSPVQTQAAPAAKPVPANVEAQPLLKRWADATPPHVTIQSQPVVTNLAAPLAISVPFLAPEPAPASQVQIPAPVLTPEPVAPTPPLKPAAMPVVGIGSITVELPPARPVEQVPAARPVEHFQMHSAPVQVAKVEYDYSGVSSVTVPLPPARPAPVPVPTPAESPKPAPKPVQQAAVLEATGPRLERLSRGEVALVTTGKPIWNAQKNVQMAAANIRWVPLASAEARPNFQILNAARVDKLAASARTVLLNRGWRRIAVGDAPAVQLKSEVQYPKNQATLGRRLAAQFGVAARLVEKGVLVLVLGRDSVDRIARPQKS